MKKISAIFISLVMLLCSYGFYIAWYVSLLAIHNSQREIILHSGLHKNELIKLVFSKNDFNKYTCFTFDDDEEEFEYNKQMYDVVTKKMINDSVYVTCISDTQEENLRDVAMVQILNREDNATGKELPIFKFRLDHYTYSFEVLAFYSFTRENSNCFIKYKTGKPGSPYIHISSPPPWFVIS